MDGVLNAFISTLKGFERRGKSFTLDSGFIKALADLNLNNTLESSEGDTEVLLDNVVDLGITSRGMDLRVDL